ncbi:palmitoyl-monogalactosyldiacylglycerol delta-7 desaturase, chloroplastic-like protein [Tanacetum coccineum]
MASSGISNITNSSEVSPEHPKEKYNLDTATKLARAKPNKRFGDADLSKDKSSPESPPEFRRSWYVEGHIRSRVISSVLMQRCQRTIRQRKANELGFSDRKKKRKKATLPQATLNAVNLKSTSDNMDHLVNMKVETEILGGLMSVSYGYTVAVRGLGRSRRMIWVGDLLSLEPVGWNFISRANRDAGACNLSRCSVIVSLLHLHLGASVSGKSKGVTSKSAVNSKARHISACVKSFNDAFKLLQQADDDKTQVVTECRYVVFGIGTMQLLSAAIYADASEAKDGCSKSGWSLNTTSVDVKESRYGKIHFFDVMVTRKRNHFLGRKWRSVDIKMGVGILGIHLLALFASFTFTWGAFWAAFGSYILCRMCGIILSYHRNLSHRSFKLLKWLECTFAYQGVSNFQRDPIYWASIHKYHHQFLTQTMITSCDDLMTRLQENGRLYGCIEANLNISISIIVL